MRSKAPPRRNRIGVTRRDGAPSYAVEMLLTHEGTAGFLAALLVTHGPQPPQESSRASRSVWLFVGCDAEFRYSSLDETNEFRRYVRAADLPPC